MYSATAITRTCTKLGPGKNAWIVKVVYKHTHLCIDWCDIFKYLRCSNKLFVQINEVALCLATSSVGDRFILVTQGRHEVLSLVLQTSNQIPYYSWATEPTKRCSSWWVWFMVKTAQAKA